MVVTPVADDGGPAELCRPFLGALPISGASVTMVASSRVGLTLCSSNTVAARVEELQFELGEGPKWVAAGSGEFVSLPDVATDDHRDWPVFGAALRELPVGALFCVPIRMGAASVGVATLYCDTARQLTDDQQVTALSIASAIAGPAIHRAMHAANDEDARESAVTPALRRTVHQATGMILVQLDTTATIAYARLQAFAFATGRSVQSVAHDVVTGVLSFEDPSS